MGTVTAYADVPSRSPWLAQQAPLGLPRPLTTDVDADVCVVGAGIAGIATSFFLLRETGHQVVLLERDRVGQGASGHNAGQLTTYFERPLHSIADEFGLAMACEGQRAFDDAHDLLDLLVAETRARVRVERFTGHMGMYSLDHVVVHLRNNAVRREGGLRREQCVVSAEAEWLADIPTELSGLYTVVPQARVRELLEVDDDRYRAVLSDRKGCANSGLLVQQVLDHLERTYPDRFRYADRTPVESICAGADGAEIEAGGHRVTASHVVVCTNGFADHETCDTSGAPVRLADDQRIVGCIGYMMAFAEAERRAPTAMSYIRNAAVGQGETPYVYVTRRTYDRADDVVTLTCMGGPEHPVEPYDPDMPFPGWLQEQMDDVVRPFANPGRPAGRPYDFAWHGLMGYNESGIRVVGAHPQHPRLLYNLACNGVGFLPSIAGASRIARTLAGESLPPSIFDPR